MLNWLRHERGQDLVEYALVLPILLALLFGIVEFALVVFSYNTIGDAARQGARYGVIGVHATDDIAGIQHAAYDVTDAAGLNRAKLSVVPTKIGDAIRVVVTYDMDLITRFAGIPSIKLQAVSTKLIELQ